MLKSLLEVGHGDEQQPGVAHDIKTEKILEKHGVRKERVEGYGRQIGLADHSCLFLAVSQVWKMEAAWTWPETDRSTRW